LSVLRQCGSINININNSAYGTTASISGENYLALRSLLLVVVMKRCNAQLRHLTAPLEAKMSVA